MATAWAAAFVPSGNAEIDQVRAEVNVTPSNAENYEDRMVLLYCWLGVLQQQGADTHPLFEFDSDCECLQHRIVRGKGDAKTKAINEMCQVIDDASQVMEDVQKKLADTGMIYKPFVGDPEGFPKGGDMGADWPMFQGNKHNTGYTKAPGRMVDPQSLR